MRISRRTSLGGLSALPLLSLATTASGAAPHTARPRQGAAKPLGKADFHLGNRTYLNAAAVHPMSLPAAAAIRHYLSGRVSMNRNESRGPDVREQFARLINAHPSEIAIVPNTTTGENFVREALEIRPGQDRVITDALHFCGSLYMYDRLSKAGLDVQVVQPKDGVIELADIEARLDTRTKLIAVSLVSMATGFKHDLKALCGIAHARGAMVYADIIQVAGNAPVDVRESGVDFAACSTYKWLMGDFGTGFLYARQDHLERLSRPIYGYEQIDFSMRELPFDPQTPGDWTQRMDASGWFQSGSQATGVEAGLGVSLDHILVAGPEQIALRRQPMIDFMREKLPLFGFEVMAPRSDAALVSFVYRDAAKRLRDKLRRARIDISLYEDRIRVAPSIYNDMKDVERLVDVLAS